MNCQQICKISCKKSTQVKIFQKVLGGLLFLKHPVGLLTCHICIRSPEYNRFVYTAVVTLQAQAYWNFTAVSS